MDSVPMIALATEIKYGTKKYVQYIPGGVNSKLVISATHGGNLRPKCIPCRNENLEKNKLDTSTEIFTKADVYTKEISILLRNELLQLSTEDKVPHLVICNLHRSRVDMNRNVTEGCLHVPEALIAYQEFHDFLSKAGDDVGKGLLLDIHGHTHKDELVELGYLLRNRDLLIDNLQSEKSSIRSLALNSSFPFKDLIRGSVSLGSFLQDEGIETIPSPHHCSTRGNCFTGGYTVLHHGSVLAGCLDAIQVEIHRKFRCVEKSPLFVSSLAKAVKEFMDLHYGGI